MLLVCPLALFVADVVVVSIDVINLQTSCQSWSLGRSLGRGLIVVARTLPIALAVLALWLAQLAGVIWNGSSQGSGDGNG